MTAVATEQRAVTARFVQSDGSVTTEPALPVFDGAGEIVAYRPVRGWKRDGLGSTEVAGEVSP